MPFFGEFLGSTLFLGLGLKGPSMVDLKCSRRFRYEIEIKHLLAWKLEFLHIENQRSSPKSRIYRKCSPRNLRGNKKYLPLKLTPLNSNFLFIGKSSVRTKWHLKVNVTNLSYNDRFDNITSLNKNRCARRGHWLSWDIIW